MQKKPLTERQCYWLDHIQSWNESRMRMSEYARDQNFPVRTMYDAKKTLLKKDILPRSDIVYDSFRASTSHRIIYLLANGVSPHYQTER